MGILNPEGILPSSPLWNIPVISVLPLFVRDRKQAASMMKSRHPFRLLAGTAFALLFVVATAFARGREPGPPPAVRPPRVTQRTAAAGARAQNQTPAPIVRSQPNGAGKPIQNQ